MKESVGEGSMSVATIVIIVGVIVVAVGVVAVFMNSIKNRENDFTHVCADGYHWSDNDDHCVQN